MAIEEQHSLLLIFAIAALAPLACEWVPRIRLPLVVLEVCLGILVGPHVLGWASAGPLVTVLANFGLAALFFLAGLEIDFPAIRGRPLAMATLGWLASFAICLGVGFALQGFGLARSALIVGAALTTTALGTLVPILRDAKETSTRFGAYVMAHGAVGEFAPIMLVVLALSSSSSGEPEGSWVLMVLFAAITVAGAFIAMTYRPPRLIVVLQEKMDTSAQLPVRLAILVLASLVILARNLGLDTILGAMAAGVLVSLASPGKHGLALRHKLDGIGYGFLVPIFFVTTGLRYDLGALVGSTSALLMLPMFLALFLVVRGLPAMLTARDDLDFRSSVALALLSSTQLPLVVAIAAIGVKSGQLSPETAASLVGAGMVSVLLFPATGLLLRRLTLPPEKANGDAVLREPVDAGLSAGSPEEQELGSQGVRN